MSVRSRKHPIAVRPRSGLQWRLQRGYEESRRLACEGSALAVVHGAVCLGPDEAVRRFFDRVGLGPDAGAIIGFRVAGYSCAVAVPTFRSWNRHDLRRRFVSAVGDATSSGRPTLLASPHEVTSQPRLGNVERMLRTMRPPAVGDAESLIRILEANNGEASLAQCEAVIAGPFAAERIFGSMAGGIVEIDLSVALSPDSRVRLRSSGCPFDWLEVGASPFPENPSPLPRVAVRDGLENDRADERGIEGTPFLCARPMFAQGETNHGP